ncbi:MAG: hypothetical protein IPG92_06410 [Flavobacteriales bacterium]|nr:hypothetical protein [Flavobacteriales bacterium]
MKVFKFGGASVKDAAGVRNLAGVLRHFASDDLLIVVSAMGKTTNALEEVVWAHAEGRSTREMLERLRASHLSVLAEVAPVDVAAAAELVLHFDRLSAVLGKGPSGMSIGTTIRSFHRARLEHPDRGCASEAYRHSEHMDRCTHRGADGQHLP